MEETFIFLQKLLQSATGIPLSRLPGNKNALSDFLQKQTNYAFGNILAENATLWHQLFRPANQGDTIYQWTAPGGITFLLYMCAGHCIVFGPVRTSPFVQDEVLLQIAHCGFDSRQQADFLQYCEALPVTEHHILLKTSELIIGHLTGRTQPLRILPIYPLEPEFFHSPTNFHQGEDIIQMRQVETRYEHSAALTDAVRQGNLSLALHLIGSYNPGKETQVRNTNPLRNAQNYCIVLNTQLRHALEKSDIHPYRVDQLSHEIGMQIEQLRSLQELPAFFQQILVRYCRLVQEHTYPNLKPLTHLTVTYIKEHLADNLTVKDTAKALTVNANYLSTLFHQDMGMTFIDFVNRERTTQAAAMLKHTNLQIQQIASIVGYNNTSYFAKQFMRFYGVSPSQYRQ